jgi:archaellum component FlaF (FlaF/FlaG flagellin family)
VIPILFIKTFYKGFVYVVYPANYTEIKTAKNKIINCFKNKIQTKTGTIKKNTKSSSEIYPIKIESLENLKLK